MVFNVSGCSSFGCHISHQNIGALRSSLVGDSSGVWGRDGGELRFFVDEGEQGWKCLHIVQLIGGVIKLPMTVTGTGTGAVGRVCMHQVVVPFHFLGQDVKRLALT